VLDFLFCYLTTLFIFHVVFQENNRAWQNMRRLIFDFHNSKYRVRICGKENWVTNFDVLTAVTLNTSVFSDATARILVARHKYFTESYSLRIDRSD
jgi:hypothetical protein